MFTIPPSVGIGALIAALVLGAVLFGFWLKRDKELKNIFWEYARYDQTAFVAQGANPPQERLYEGVKNQCQLLGYRAIVLADTLCSHGIAEEHLQCLRQSGTRCAAFFTANCRGRFMYLQDPVPSHTVRKLLDLPGLPPQQKKTLQVWIEDVENWTAIVRKKVFDLAFSLDRT